MKNILATISTMAIGCFLLSSLCQGAEGPRQKENLEIAWQNMTSGEPVVTSQPSVWSVDNPAVSEFLSGKMGALKEMVADAQDIVRMKAVLATNQEKGCIWLLVQSRMQHTAGKANVIRTSTDCKNYQELCLFLIDELTDLSESSLSSGSAQASWPTYPWRICDLAYLELQRRLPKETACSSVYLDGANAATQSTTKPAIFSEVDFGARTGYAQRDKQIQLLYEWIHTEAGKKWLADMPSALAIVSKTKDMPDEIRVVRLMLGRNRPRIIEMKDVPTNIPLLDVLENEVPPLSKSEEASRQRLLSDKYSAKDVVVRLPQDSLRQRGHIEWVLLKRQDRPEIAKALRELSKDERAYVQIAVIELTGELLHTWGKDDATAIEDIVDLLKKISKDTSISWAIRLRAQQALEQGTDKTGKE